MINDRTLSEECVKMEEVYVFKGLMKSKEVGRFLIFFCESDESA